MSILENMREIADLIKKSNDIELYRRFVELEGDIVELTRKNRSFAEENEELKRALSFSKGMTFNEPFYFMSGDKVPFCSRCWEGDKKTIHLTGPIRVATGSRYDCPNCNTAFFVKDTGQGYFKMEKLKRDLPLSKEVEMIASEFEKMRIIEALDKAGWRREKAASLLRISLKTLYNKMNKYGLLHRSY